MKKKTSLSSYSYTRVRNVSSVFGDKVSFRYIECCFASSPCKDRPFYIYIYFMAHLICASSAEIKTAKSHNCIIDRAGHHLSPLDSCIARTEKCHARSERKAQYYYSTVQYTIKGSTSPILHDASRLAFQIPPRNLLISPVSFSKSKPQSRFQSRKITAHLPQTPQNSRVPSQEFGYRYLFQYRTLIATIHMLFIYISTSTS